MPLPELIGPAGELENDSRFFAEPTDDFSDPSELATRDLALADFVDTI